MKGAGGMADTRAASRSQQTVKSGKNSKADISCPLQIIDFKNIYWILVPKKGLEPPHPCEYVDLNHARLPIPPLRHGYQCRRSPPHWQHF